MAEENIPENSNCCLGQSCTAFKQHPGGVTLLSAAGKVSDEAAKLLFLSYHHTKDFDKIYAFADKYGYTEAASIKRTPLYNELDDVMSKTCTKYWIHGLVYKCYCYGLTVLLFYLFYNHMFSRSISMFNSLVLAFAWTSYGFSIFHIRNHTPSLFVNNRFVNGMYEVMDNGFCDVLPRWIRSHQTLHHLYANTVHDFDVVLLYPAIYPGDEYGFERKFYHKFQAFYVPILLAVFQYTRVWRHLTVWLRGDDGGNPLYILLYYGTLIITPYYCNDNGLWANILNYLFIKAVLGTTCNYLFLVSHNNSANAHKGQNNTKEYNKWIKQQIEESLSWCNDESSVIDYIVTMVVGGINLQIEHHIAPSVLPIYYLFAAKDIKRVCKKHDIEYNWSRNFFSAIYEFHLYLFRIAK